MGRDAAPIIRDGGHAAGRGREAAKLHDARHTILNETPFLIRRSAIKTITGEDEAFFGAVGANYAVNAIDADETPSDGAGT